VSQVEPEDVYDDRSRHTSTHSHSRQNSRQELNNYYEDQYSDRYATVRASHHAYAHALAAPPPARQISGTSQSSTTVSGSENWETYDDNSEPEHDVSDMYYAKLRATRGKRFEPEQGHRPGSSHAKRPRGIPGGASYGSGTMVDENGSRIVSGSEWTDEDAY
jgi:protein regulator of cytokinesis 1